MGIDVKRETEYGEQEEVVFDPKGLFPALLNRCRNYSWRLIQYIDLHGDTIFNQLQVPVLLDELRELTEQTQSDEERTFLKAVLDLVEGSKNQVHTHVRFCGD
jgi:hypothetical protein